MRRRVWIAAAGVLWAAALLAAGARSPDGAGGPEVVEWKDVLFPHAMHAKDLGIDCASCHHETNAGALSIPHEQYFENLWIDCGACHKPGATAAAPVACTQCHHDSPAGATDETLSAKVVLHKSCWSCHEAGRGAAASRSCKACHRGGGGAKS
jgi:hypothetical protein